jgi:diguanylate cyclase (GGDEF)-like protein/PAS domain S-box-containing protein
VHERDEQYRVMVQTSPDGIVLTRLDGTILLANEATARLCGGQRPEDFGGRSMVDLVTVEDRVRVQDLIDDAIQTREIQTVECRLHDGQHGVVTECAISVSTDETGEPTGLLCVLRDVTKYKQREAELQDQTLHDPLTGLPNRVLLHDRLAHAIDSARRSASPVSVLYIDLDHFKAVNDSFGHDFADILLQKTARRMQQTMRASDTLGRLGGDEFAAVLPQTDAPGATVMVAKLKDELGTSFEIVGHTINIGASIGIAVYPVHGQDAATVLRRADIAMYANKRSGREHGVRDSHREDLVGSPPLPVYTSRTADAFTVQVDRRVLSVAQRRRQHSD